MYLTNPEILLQENLQLYFYFFVHVFDFVGSTWKENDV